MNSRSYRITIEGRLSDRFASAFEGMRLQASDGKTILLGEGWIKDISSEYSTVFAISASS
ncbi:MAG: hypothetical protein ACR2I4_08320 [Actinomycetota bacterium]|nr:hypothetical protein [Actinomycetota bacterium]